MIILRQTIPHFVRCIKPNSEQTANKMESTLILNQLKYSGLFEAIHIRKAGYEIRLPFDVVITRYKHCALSDAAVVTSIKSLDKSDSKSNAVLLIEYMMKFISTNERFIARKKDLEKGSLALAKKKKGIGAAAGAEDKKSR
jgi:myosin heavy subunit